VPKLCRGLHVVKPLVKRRTDHFRDVSSAIGNTRVQHMARLSVLAAAILFLTADPM
jgi:hypothetical protein